MLDYFLGLLLMYKYSCKVNLYSFISFVILCIILMVISFVCVQQLNDKYFTDDIETELIKQWLSLCNMLSP